MLTLHKFSTNKKKQKKKEGWVLNRFDIVAEKIDYNIHFWSTKMILKL